MERADHLCLLVSCSLQGDGGAVTVPAGKVDGLNPTSRIFHVAPGDYASNYHLFCRSAKLLQERSPCGGGQFGQLASESIAKIAPVLTVEVA